MLKFLPQFNCFGEIIGQTTKLFLTGSRFVELSTHIPDYILMVELREKFHLSRDLLCELFVSGVQRDSLDGV